MSKKRYPTRTSSLRNKKNREETPRGGHTASTAFVTAGKFNRPQVAIAEHRRTCTNHQH